ncbi:hypothetical protein JTB14_033131 [Gonioctena quinquepunctata]|nr:hypothetical protein JTB14_033131 [Gonioctena quinquepunctata]
MDTGFLQGKTDNLPKITSLSVCYFLGNNPNFVGAEMRNMKTSRCIFYLLLSNSDPFLNCSKHGYVFHPAERKKCNNLIRRQDREPSKHSLRKFDFESPEKRKRTVEAREVEANLLSALEATNMSSEAVEPSKISETETPSTSRSEGRLSSIEDIPSCSRSVSRASSASVEAEN